MIKDIYSLLDLEPSLEQIDDILTISSILKDTLVRIELEGVSRFDIESVCTVTDSILSDNYPIESYTRNPSFINIDVAQESLIGNIIKGMEKIFELILNSLKAFFGRIGDIVSGLVKRFTGKGDKTEDTKTKAVIAAIENKSPSEKADNKTFKNVINEKVVTGATTEQFLDLVYRDKSGREYKDIRKILQGFFREKIDDVTWKEFVKNKNTKLKTITDYVLNWWNNTHPIVATHGNVSYDFIVEDVRFINFLIHSVVERLNWWFNRIGDIAKAEPAEIDKRISILKDSVNENWKNLQEEILNKLDNLFSPLTFIRVNIGADPVVSVKNTLESFKAAKVKPSSKIDFMNSIKKIEWVSGINELDDNVEMAKKLIKNNEEESNKIIDQIKSKYFKDNRALVSKIGHFLKDIKRENQQIIFLSAMMLTFITLIEDKIADNRKRIADLHFLIVSLGVDITESI